MIPIVTLLRPGALQTPGPLLLAPPCTGAAAFSLKRKSDRERERERGRDRKRERERASCEVQLRTMLAYLALRLWEQAPSKAAGRFC